ncbi:MAG: hypothetical protein O7D86_15525 [Proteobacteria bacterium]|nr:hypothetical protein [Pseudomonadota bacterium]
MLYSIANTIESLCDKLNDVYWKLEEIERSFSDPERYSEYDEFESGD